MKPYHIQKSKEANERGLIFWGLTVFTLLLLTLSPFQTGLFNGYTPQYEGPIYVTVMAGAFLLLLLSIYFFSKWRLESYPDLLSIYVILIPVTYWLSTSVAASVHLSKNMSYIHMMYAALFLCGLYAARDKLGAAILQYTIVLSGYAIVLYGMANVLGNAYSRDAVMFTDQGYRITSVFQYSNAYAAFLLCILLCALYYVVRSKHWILTGLHAMMLVPIMLSFWLTLSRGGIVTFPFIFLLVLPLLTFSRQLAFTIYSFITVVLVFPLLKPIENKSTELLQKYVLPSVPANANKANPLSWFDGRSLSGWAMILGAALLGAALVTVLQRWVMPKLEAKLARFTSRKLSRVAFPLGLVAVMIVGALLLFGTGVKEVLPESIQKRVENINFKQHSVLERGVFYKDSIKVVKDHPLLGAGGGGWAAVYEKYQNNPYVSRQAHNFFLQYLVEVGIVGFAVFVGLLLLVFVPFVRRSFKLGHESTDEHLVFYLVAVSMLIHSILDFDMSYVYFGALVYLCLGGMGAVLDRPVAWLAKLKPGAAYRYSYAGVMLAVSIIFVFLSITYVSGDRAFGSALKQAKAGQDYNTVMKSLDLALERIPNHPDYLLQKARFMTQVYSQTKNDAFWQEAMKVVQTLGTKEPHYRQGFEQEYTLLVMKQQFEEAYQSNERAIANYVWDISLYERKATLLSTMWNQPQNANNPELKAQYAKEMEANYQEVARRMAELAKLPKEQLQGRPFYLTPLIRYSVGQVYYLNGEFDKAYAELQPAGQEAIEKLKGQLQPDVAVQMNTIELWYHAAAIQVSKQDQAAYDAFVQANPESKQQIEALLQNKAVPASAAQ